MKSLAYTLQTRFIFLLVGSVLISYLGSYFLVKTLLIKNGITVEELNTIYISLGFFLLFVLALSVYLYSKLLHRLKYDLEQVREYLYDISENKDYNSTIKIDNFTEFLQISLVLKNIVKRLNQKEKKTSKK